MRRSRPYVVIPTGWPARGRMRTYGSREAAVRAARRIANETGQPVRIEMRSPVHGTVSLGERHYQPSEMVVEPSWRRDRDPDVDLAKWRG